MQRGKEPSRFRVVRIKRKEFFQRSGRPAILAGVHVGDRFLQKRTFFTVADNTPFLHPRWSLFVNLFGGFLVGPHVTTLADHSKLQSGFSGHFAHVYTSVRFLAIEGANPTKSAILMPLLSSWKI